MGGEVSFKQFSTNKSFIRVSDYPFGKESIVPFATERTASIEALLIAANFHQTVSINFHKKLFFSSRGRSHPPPTFPSLLLFGIHFRRFLVLKARRSNERKKDDQGWKHIKAFLIRLKGSCSTRRCDKAASAMKKTTTETTHHRNMSDIIVLMLFILRSFVQMKLLAKGKGNL